MVENNESLAKLYGLAAALSKWLAAKKIAKPLTRARCYIE
jgi:hypothetical protein